jgi:4-azaleucine resistance transporter AzlC
MSAMPEHPSQALPESDFAPAENPLDRTAESALATRRQRFARGCRLGLPILLGYAPVGAAFGVVARSLGFTPFEATVCSATALAGAGQFIALSLLGSGANAVAALIATTVVNLRYVLFSATLSPHLSGVRLPGLAWLGFTLTDETFAVNVADIRHGRASASSMAGVGFIAWSGWVAGTAIGAWAASSIGDPSRFGVEFAMPAMFAALFVALAEDRRHVYVGLLAAAIAIALPALASVGVPIGTNWFVVIASMAAAGIATVVIRDE